MTCRLRSLVHRAGAAARFEAGSLKEGGSTITQQLAKNLFLESDKTFTRKVKELGYAVKINFTYSKDEILELYLNSIFFGEGRWGVEGAAQQYFGKPVKELSLAESAMIAGLPKAPTHFSPVKNTDKALERRNLVLSLMKEQGFITEAAYAKAVEQPIVLKTNNGESLKGRYPSFVDYVMDEAEKLYGFTEQQVLTLGLRIHTTMDVKVQQAAEEVYRSDGLISRGSGGPARPERHRRARPPHGRHPGDRRRTRRAGITRLQPGHKVEASARLFIQAARRLRPGSRTRVYSRVVAVRRGARYRRLPAQKLGRSDARTGHAAGGRAALMEHPPVWLLNEIGLDTGIDYVRRAGITLPAADRNLSLALGGLSEGVSPLQMAQAYGAIANLGVMERAHAITPNLTTKDGHPLVEAGPQPTTLTAPVHAYTLTQLLQEAVAVGTGKAAALDGRPTAGQDGHDATSEYARIRKYRRQRCEGRLVRRLHAGADRRHLARLRQDRPKSLSYHLGRCCAG